MFASLKNRSRKCAAALIAATAMFGLQTLPAHSSDVGMTANQGLYISSQSSWDYNIITTDTSTAKKIVIGYHGLIYLDVSGKLHGTEGTSTSGSDTWSLAYNGSDTYKDIVATSSLFFIAIKTDGTLELLEEQPSSNSSNHYNLVPVSAASQSKYTSGAFIHNISQHAKAPFDHFIPSEGGVFLQDTQGNIYTNIDGLPDIKLGSDQLVSTTSKDDITVLNTTSGKTLAFSEGKVLKLSQEIEKANIVKVAASKKDIFYLLDKTGHVHYVKVSGDTLTALTSQEISDLIPSSSSTGTCKAVAEGVKDVSYPGWFIMTNGKTIPIAECSGVTLPISWPKNASKIIDSGSVVYMSNSKLLDTTAKKTDNSAEKVLVVAGLVGLLPTAGLWLWANKYSPRTRKVA